MSIPTNDNKIKEASLVEGYAEIVSKDLAVSVVLPFEVEKGEEYHIEQIGKLRKKPFYSFFKRLFDIVFSLIALSLLILPFIVVAIIIKCSSKGSVFSIYLCNGPRGIYRFYKRDSFRKRCRYFRDIWM